MKKHDIPTKQEYWYKYQRAHTIMGADDGLWFLFKSDLPDLDGMKYNRGIIHYVCDYSGSKWNPVQEALFVMKEHHINSHHFKIYL